MEFNPNFFLQPSSSQSSLNSCDSQMAASLFPPGVFGVEVEIGYYENRDKVLLWKFLRRKELRFAIEDQLLLQQV